MERLVATAVVALLVSSAATTAAGPALVLSPAQGLAAQSFTATFTFQPASACPRYLVAFSWDGLPLAGSPLAAISIGSHQCQASLTASPPAGDAGAGGHTVAAATTPSGFAASATFTVQGSQPPPTPGPGPTPRPLPAPATSPVPKPSPRSAAPAGVQPSQPVCAPARAARPGLGDQLTLLAPPRSPQQAAVLAVVPPSMLPPALGHHQLVALGVIVGGSAAPVLARDLVAGTVFPCVLLYFGRQAHLAFAAYAFTEAKLLQQLEPGAGFPAASETFVFSYHEVRWLYQPLDAAGRDLAVISGSGVYLTGGQIDSPTRAPLDWWQVIDGLLLLVIAGGLAALARINGWGRHK